MHVVGNANAQQNELFFYVQVRLVQQARLCSSSLTHGLVLAISSNVGHCSKNKPVLDMHSFANYFCQSKWQITSFTMYVHATAVFFW